MRLCLLAAIGIPYLCGVLWSACLPIRDGESIEAAASSQISACLVAAVENGRASQLIIQQPADLEIRVEGESTPILVDGFEFGRETVTLSLPGVHRLEVRRVNSSGPAVTFLVLRQRFSLDEAGKWRLAEDWATESKRLPKAEDISESLDQWKRIGDPSAIARTHLKHANSLLARNPGEARGAYEEALALCRSLADWRCAGEAANNDGLAAEQLADFSDALERLNEAAKSWERISDSVDSGHTLQNLGQLFRRVGDFQQAISYYDRAKPLLQSDAVAYGQLLNNLGVSFLSLAETEKARAQFEEALARYGRTAPLAAVLRTRLNLGRSYLLLGNLDHAQQILEDTETAARMDPSARADTLDNLGQTYLARHRIARARMSLEEALALHRSVGDRRGEAYDLHYLGLAAAADGEVESARRDLRNSLEIRLATGLRDDASDSLSALAVVERDAGSADAASTLAEQGLTLLESLRLSVPGAALRASYYARKRRLLDLLVDLAMGDGRPQAPIDGFLAAERGRGRALLDLLAEGRVVEQGQPELQKQRNAIEHRIDLLSVRLTGATEQQAAPLRSSLQSLIAEDDELEAALGQTVAHHAIAQPLDSLDRLQRALPQDAALLEYHLGEWHSWLWLVDRGHIRAFPLQARAAIESQAASVIDLFHRVLDRQRSPDKQAEFEQATRRLSATLFGSLKDVALPPRLILAPDGVLNAVAFAALRLPRTNQPLGLAHDLIQVPSAAYLTVGRQPRPLREFPKTILAIADPVFSPNDPRVSTSLLKSTPAAEADLARLPFAGELDSVTSLVPVSRREILRGFDVNPQALAAGRLRDFAILHLSTHAIIDPVMPELSRVALSMVDRSGRPVDGMLRPYHLAQLSLNGSIVVLSACSTARGKQVLGEGEGLVGFTTSLFLAGASQLVMNVAEVDAEAAADFFSNVYGRLLSGQTGLMAHALTLARRAVSGNPRWADPYYWASTIVIGSPSGGQ
jgi:CHAT domain-containing protein